MTDGVLCPRCEPAVSYRKKANLKGKPAKKAKAPAEDGDGSGE